MSIFAGRFAFVAHEPVAETAFFASVYSHLRRKLRVGFVHRAILASLLALACRPAGQTFIVAGQSNAGGRSTLDAPHPVPDLGVGYALAAWGEWKLAADPLDKRPDFDRRSPWPDFAALRHAAGRPAWIVQTAEGATCLAFGTARWGPDGDLYPRMLRRARDAKALHFPHARAVLWHQGECDAEADVPLGEIREGYRDALMALADAVGADLGLPLIAALPTLRKPGYGEVRGAIEEAAALHPGIYLGPETADLALEADGIHVRDVATLGARWADAVEAMP